MRDAKKRENMVISWEELSWYFKTFFFFFSPNYLGTKERANLVRLVRDREELASALTFSSHLRLL